MADYTQTLAQLLAQSRQGNSLVARDAQPTFAPYAVGSTNQGYGATGEAFGKGIGEYIKQTYVEAEKQRYLEENDPVRIQAKAEKDFNIYQSMSPSEQDQYDKWLNESPEGLRWLKQMQKAGQHLLTKVPMTTPGQTGQAPLPPGVSKDDKEMVRFMRVLPSTERQKAILQQGLSPEQQQAMAFSKENKEIAEGGLATAQKTELPIRTGIMQKEADAAMMKAQADKDMVQVHRDAEARHQSMVETDKREKTAHTSYLYAMAERARVNNKTDELALKMDLARLKGVDDKINLLLKDDDNFKTKVITSNIASPQQDELLFNNDRKVASQIRSIDPGNPLVKMRLDNAAGMLVDKAEEHNRAVAKFKSSMWNRLPMVGAPAPGSLDPKWSGMASGLMREWKNNVTSYPEAEAMVNAYGKLMKYYRLDNNQEKVYKDMLAELEQLRRESIASQKNLPTPKRR